MKRLLPFLLLVGTASSVNGQTRANELPAFVIVLEQTKDGWAAECERGCSWTQVAITCVGNCTPVIDQHGIYRSERTERESSPFAFTVHAAERGVSVMKLHGTAWVKAGASCERPGCQVQITELGIQPLAAGRPADDA